MVVWVQIDHPFVETPNIYSDLQTSPFLGSPFSMTPFPPIGQERSAEREGRQAEQLQAASLADELHLDVWSEGQWGWSQVPTRW